MGSCILQVPPTPPGWLRQSKESLVVARPVSHTWTTELGPPKTLHPRYTPYNSMGIAGQINHANTITEQTKQPSIKNKTNKHSNNKAQPSRRRERGLGAHRFSPSPKVPTTSAAGRLMRNPFTATPPCGWSCVLAHHKGEASQG